MVAKDTTALLHQAIAVAEKSLGSLRYCVERVDESLRAATAYDSKLASHQAYLAAGVSQLVETLRKAEAHEAKRADELTAEEQDRLIAEHVRDLPIDRRAELRGLLDEIDESEGVLG